MSPSKPTQILIIGASYAGLAAATNLLDLSEGRPQRFSPTDPAPTTTFPIEITIVDERDGYYHVIGSPLALASPSFAQRSWTRFEDIPGLQHPSIKFVHGSVIEVDTDSKTAKLSPHGSQGNVEAVIEQQYDYLLAASGLRRVAPVVPASLTRQDYLTETDSHIARVKDAVAKEGVVVIGGGAVGIEMAAELNLVYPDLKVRLIHSRDRLLSSEPLPDDFKDETLRLLREVGVEVLTGRRVNDISQPDETTGNITLTLSNEETITASFVINAISHATPTSGYLPPMTLTEEGHVKIEPTLHFMPNTSNASTSTAPSYDRHHLAAGDITHWPGIRRCGAAMHMGCFAAHNIHAHILSTLLPTSSSQSSTPPVYKSLATHPPMIGLALGKTGIAYSPTEGTKSGVNILQSMFQDDIGFSICWNYMKLGEGVATVHAGPADVVETETENQTETVADDLNKSTSQMTLDEWIAEAESKPHPRSSSLSEPVDDGSAGSPSLSTTSTPSSPVEPRTPIDAVGNAEVTNFEVLDVSGYEKGEVAGTGTGTANVASQDVVVDVNVDANGKGKEAASMTKVSPIRVVESRGD